MNKFDILCDHKGFIQSTEGPKAYLRPMRVSEVLAFQESAQDVPEFELCTSILKRTLLYPSYDEYMDDDDLLPVHIINTAASVLNVSSPSTEEELEARLEQGKVNADNWIHSLVFTAMDQGNLDYSSALNMNLTELATQLGYLSIKADAINPKRKQARGPSAISQATIDRLNRNTPSAKGEAEIEEESPDLVPMSEEERRRQLEIIESRRSAFERSKKVAESYGKTLNVRDEQLLPLSPDEEMREAHGVGSERAAYSGISAQVQAAFDYLAEQPEDSKLPIDYKKAKFL